MREAAASPEIVDCCCPQATNVIPKMVSKAHVNLALVAFFFICPLLTRSEPVKNSAPGSVEHLIYSNIAI
jgi:hypothetical protein